MANKKKVSTDVVTDVFSAEEKLGPDVIAEIAEREWKTAPLPTEEELAKEKHKSPKARNNPNSRRNLTQYRKDKPKEVKEKIVKGLQYSEKREDINPLDYLTLPEGFDSKLIVSFLPDRRVMKDSEEEKYFYSVLNAFLSDFDLDELSSSDVEDIVSLAVNRMLENRLLALAAVDPNMLMDVSTTIEKFRKHSDKIKGNLVSRRSDHVDPSNKQNFSIVDLVHAFEDKKGTDFTDRMNSVEEDMKTFLDKKNS